MTHTITVTRCGECPMYCEEDVFHSTPEMCLHHDSGWSTEPVRPQELSMPPNCPLLQSPVTYRAERKGE